MPKQTKKALLIAKTEQFIKENVGTWTPAESIFEKMEKPSENLKDYPKENTVRKNMELIEQKKKEYTDYLVSKDISQKSKEELYTSILKDYLKVVKSVCKFPKAVMDKLYKEYSYYNDMMSNEYNPAFIHVRFNYDKTGFKKIVRHVMFRALELEDVYRDNVKLFKRVGNANLIDKMDFPDYKPKFTEFKEKYVPQGLVNTVEELLEKDSKYLDFTYAELESELVKYNKELKKEVRLKNAETEKNLEKEVMNRKKYIKDTAVDFIVENSGLNKEQATLAFYKVGYKRFLRKALDKQTIKEGYMSGVQLPTRLALLKFCKYLY